MTEPTNTDTETAPLFAADGQPDKDRLTARLRLLALEAGAAILRVANSAAADAWDKEDGSPVTEADHVAERVILQGLKAIDGRITIVSEEAFAAGYRPGADETFWLVDPLDGTREFVSGNGEYTVNIALIRNRQPVLGVVHCPARGTSAWGIVGMGAFESDPKGAITPLKVRTVPNEGAVVIASRRHGDPDRLNTFLDGRPVAAWRSAGSSLKFVEIAAGRADIYPRFGTTMEWDTAAGDAVLRAAGGVTRTVEGDVLTYGKPGYVNPEFVATGE